MKPCLSNFSKWVIEHRVSVIVLSLIFICIAAVKVPSIEFQSGEEIWFKKDNAVLKDYQLDQKLFGNSMQMVVSYQRQQLDEEEQFLEKFSKEVSEFSGIEKVISLRNLSQVDGLAHKKYLSPDNKYALIYLKVKLNKKNKSSILSNTVKELDAWFATECPAQEYHLSGAALNGRIYINNEHDTNLIAPLFMLIVPLFLFFLFKRRVSSLVIFPVIIFSCTGTIGLMGWLGWKMNILNGVILLIIMTVAVAGSVHVFSDFFRHQKSLGSKAAASQSIKDLLFPCFITSLTTALGFVSLALTAELQPMVEFGVCAGVGVMLSFIGIIFLLPALLSYSRVKDNQIFQKGDAFFSRLSSIRPSQGVFLTLFLMGIFTAGIFFGSQLKADSSVKNFFRDGSRAHIDIEHFEEQYGGMASIELIVRQNKKFSSGDLSSLVNLEKLLKKDKLVKNVLTSYILTAGISSQGLSGDGQAVKSYILLNSTSDREIAAVAKRVHETCKNSFPQYEFTVTGKMVLLSNMNQYINDGMRYSLSLSLVLIFICLLLFLRRLKDSLSAIVLSIVPVLFAAIIMYFLDIQLNLTSMIIAATCFSIAVDDSIHIVSRYRKIRQQENRNDSLYQCLQQCGKPVIFTSLILALGFGLNFLGHHQPTREFGILGCTIIIVAVITDIFGFTALHKTQSFFLSKGSKASDE